jgi:hypothetical protein
MKKVSLVWFPIGALIITLTLISCGSSNGGGEEGLLLLQAHNSIPASGMEAK